MSNKSVPHPGDVYGHAPAHVAEIKLLYPAQIAPKTVSFRWPCGWHGIVLEVCGFAAKHYPDLRWIEIKEKFGALRMVHLLHRDASQVDERIDAAYQRSARTCALCAKTVDVGVAGADVGLTCLSGWWIAVCNDCAPVIQEFRSADGTGD